MSTSKYGRGRYGRGKYSRGISTRPTPACRTFKVAARENVTFVQSCDRVFSVMGVARLSNVESQLRGYNVLPQSRLIILTGC